jgi:hypothetical protein
MLQGFHWDNEHYMRLSPACITTSPQLLQSKLRNKGSVYESADWSMSSLNSFSVPWAPFHYGLAHPKIVERAARQWLRMRRVFKLQPGSTRIVNTDPAYWWKKNCYFWASTRGQPIRDCHRLSPSPFNLNLGFGRITSNLRSRLLCESVSLILNVDQSLRMI